MLFIEQQLELEWQGLLEQFKPNFLLDKPRSIKLKHQKIVIWRQFGLKLQNSYLELRDTLYLRHIRRRRRC